MLKKIKHTGLDNLTKEQFEKAKLLQEKSLSEYHPCNVYGGHVSQEFVLPEHKGVFSKIVSESYLIILMRPKCIVYESVDGKFIYKCDLWEIDGGRDICMKVYMASTYVWGIKTELEYNINFNRRHDVMNLVGKKVEAMLKNYFANRQSE